MKSDPGGKLCEVMSTDKSLDHLIFIFTMYRDQVGAKIPTVLLENNTSVSAFEKNTMQSVLFKDKTGKN